MCAQKKISFIPKQKMTEEQKKNRKLKLKKRDTERYAYRKEHGLCVACGEKNENGRVLCDSCRQKRSERARLDMEFYRSLGICTACKKKTVTNGNRQCEECHKKHAEYWKIRYKGMKRKG